MNRHGSCSPRCPTSTSTGSWNPNVSTPSSSKRRVWPSCPRCFTAPHWRDSEPSWSAIQQLPPIVQSKQDYVHRATQTIAAHAPYPGSPVIVVDTAGSATCATQEGGFSRYNESTARLCAELAVQAVNDGIDSVAIIIPYVEQSRRIRRLLPSDQNLSGKIECRAVHRFQGGERDGHLRHGRCRSPATRHSCSPATPPVLPPPISSTSVCRGPAANSSSSPTSVTYAGTLRPGCCLMYCRRPSASAGARGCPILLKLQAAYWAADTPRAHREISAPHRRSTRHRIPACQVVSSDPLRP